MYIAKFPMQKNTTLFPTNPSSVDSKNCTHAHTLDPPSILICRLLVTQTANVEGDIPKYVPGSAITVILSSLKYFSNELLIAVDNFLKTSSLP